MECGICFDHFDAARHRPKVLVPCGHSYCLACLQGLRERRCPKCRQEFTSAAEDLPDNFSILEILDRHPRQPRLKMWCCDCQTAAKPTCEATHSVKSFQAALEDKLQDLQVQSKPLAEDLPAALRVDDDDAREHALHVLELARQPGTTLEVSVRGKSGEALTATWTTPPPAPSGQQGAAEAVQAVTTKVLVLALAKKGLWQQRAEAAGQDLPVLDELEVPEFPTPEREDELLRTVREHRVRRLDSVWCYDPAWSLQMLQLAAPHVEEVRIYSASREHLEVVFAMPRLWRLEVSACFDCDDESDLVPPLSTHRVGLRWLAVFGLPRKTTFRLIRRHAGTLEELRLGVSTPGGGRWPGCDDLHVTLGRYGLARLWRLVLERYHYHRDFEACPAQLRAVRSALPGVLVQCNKCDNKEDVSNF